jgi:hypothetical protein
MADNFLKISKGINLKPQGTAPSNPAEGDIYFDGQDDAFKRYENGAWRLFGEGEGGGSGGTGENFLFNGNAERSESPWELVQNTTPGATPTPNATAAPNENVTITRTDSSPLNGGHSWLLTKDAANRQGHTLRAAIEIPEGYRDGNVWLKFLAEVSGFGSDVVKPFISFGDGTTWDAPQELTPAISKLQQAAITYPSGETHALIQFHIATTSATAGTVKLDDVQYTPEGFVQTIIERSAVIDLTSSGDFTAGQFRISKVGDKVTLREITACTFPSNATPQSAAGVLPSWARPASTVTNLYYQFSGTFFLVVAFADGRVGFEFRNSSGGNVNRTGTPAALSFISYPVPDSDPKPLLSTSEVQGQVASASIVGKSASQTGIVAEEVVVLDGVTTEIGGAFEWEPSNNGFRVKQNVSKAFISTQLRMRQQTANQASIVRIYNNSSMITESFTRHSVTGIDGELTNSAAHLVYNLKAGDLITVRAAGGGSGADVRSSDFANWLQIQAIPDLSVFGAYFDGKWHTMPEVKADYVQRVPNYSTDSHVPIVASWSNSDGFAVRYADGTVRYRATGTFPLGSGTTQNYTLPGPISDPIGHVGLASNNQTIKQMWYDSAVTGAPTTTVWQVRGVSVAGSESVTIHMVAEGRWRAIPSV